MEKRLNRAAYMTKLDTIEIRDVPLPVPKEEEVLIKVEYVGICGSDVHYFHSGRCGDFVVNGDFILGHECSGTVVETGSKVKNLKVGDRVALEPGITCGRCEFCKSGKYNLCPEVKFLATPPVQGGFVNYIAFPENMCFKLPEQVSTREGALVEPLAVGMYAAEKGEIKPGDSVVILGAGCIGLVTLMACKACGATDIIVVDVLEKRLKYAEKLGASRTVNGKDSNIIKEIERITHGKGVNKVFEAAGSAITTAQTPYLVKKGGMIVLVGLTENPKITFDFGPVMEKEAEIRSVFRYRNIYPAAISAIAQNMIPIEEIVTHEFDFEKIQEAFIKNVYEKNEIVKAVIKITS